MSKLDNTKTRITTITVAIALVLLLFFTGDLLPGISLPCIHYQLTGIQCPLCGLTRASNAIIHLHWLDALRYNPLVSLLGLFLITEILDISQKSQQTKLFRKYVLIALAAGVIMLYAVRIMGHFYPVISFLRI
jgi:hypothetical protein